MLLITKQIHLLRFAQCLIFLFSEEEEEWWTDDASDFDMDSDSDEEERLCNTAMLTGPLGVGKTATVYALAQELGFKVCI